MTSTKIRYKIHIEDTKNSKPRPHEKAAAELLANHFQSDLIFLRRSDSKTPDFYILETNTRWELKSPLGGGKHTIQNNLRASAKQSENIILDLSRAKLTTQQGASRAKEFLKNEHSQIRRLKLLTKNGKIIDIKS